MGVRYSIRELADLAGVSVRTLRYYEELGLLSPGREANGYRSYGADDLRRLQDVLAMRACSLPLRVIRELLDSDEPDTRTALLAHLQTLEARRREIDEAIRRTRRAMTLVEGMEAMDDEQRFEEIKRQSIKTFEETYGREARELYGSETIDAANEKFARMSQDEWDAKELLEQAIKVQLRAAMASGDPTGQAARELAEMHAAWIQMHWPDGTYTAVAHKALAQGYLADPRFVAYYDSAAGKGATAFLVEALLANL